MQVLQVKNVRISGISACLPANAEDSLERCTALYGDADKAAGIVRATGIRKRRIAAQGVSSLDLCVAAAERLMESVGVSDGDIGAVVAVTFTPERQMPCNACQAQSRLGLPRDIVAFDVSLACSGWPYGLYVAGMLAGATGKKTLLLDGDVQTPRIAPDDRSTIPVLADAGTATLVEPAENGASGTPEPWRFAFLSDGAKGGALSMPPGGSLSMDGLGVFRFVAQDVRLFIGGFMEAAGVSPDGVDAFVPHQANAYMVEQLAKELGFDRRKLWTSCGEFGNSASATIPVTIAHCAEAGLPGGGRILASGFGGGLSASAALVPLPHDCRFSLFDYDR